MPLSLIFNIPGNPMVMEQCEDRCYRFGQQKDVYISYYDTLATIDDIMRKKIHLFFYRRLYNFFPWLTSIAIVLHLRSLTGKINETKFNNSAIVLNDGISLNTSLSFQDLSGKFPGFLKELQKGRLSILAKEKTVEDIFDNVHPRNPKRTLQVSTIIEPSKKAKLTANDDNDGVNSIHSNVGSDHISFWCLDSDGESPRIVSDGASTENMKDTPSPPCGNKEKDTSSANCNMDRLKILVSMYNKRKNEK
jgi:hypothetical protein